MMMQNKTMEEHLQFVESASRLGFNVAFNLQKSLPEETLEYILRLRSPLYSITLMLDVEKPLPIFMDLPNAADADDFERQMWERCKDYILKRGEEIYGQSRGMPVNKDDFPAECFRYDAPRKETPDRCFFHIRNAMAPDSFLKYESYVADLLRRLMTLMKKDYGVDIIGTNSWLNSNPRWLRFFPKVWLDNKEERPLIPQWHLGYWGQILTAKGTFNQKVGDFIRKNGKMYYETCYCCCTMDELRQHLDEHF